MFLILWSCVAARLGSRPNYGIFPNPMNTRIHRASILMHPPPFPPYIRSLTIRPVFVPVGEVSRIDRKDPGGNLETVTWSGDLTYPILYTCA